MSEWISPTGDGTSPWAPSWSARAPITRSIVGWLEIAARLHAVGEDGLAASTQQAMDGRRIRDNATCALTVDEQLRVNAMLSDWLGEQDPD